MTAGRINDCRVLGDFTVSNTNTGHKLGIIATLGPKYLVCSCNSYLEINLEVPTVASLGGLVPRFLPFPYYMSRMELLLSLVFDLDMTIQFPWYTVICTGFVGIERHTFLANRFTRLLLW